MVGRRREGCAGIETQERRVHPWIRGDAGTRGAHRHAEHHGAIRPRARRDRIDVALLEQVFAPRADIADRQRRGFEKLTLHVHVPLLLVRRARRLIVDALALSRERSGDRREWRWKRWRDRGQILPADEVRRIEIVRRRVHARSDEVVEYSESAAYR